MLDDRGHVRAGYGRPRSRLRFVETATNDAGSTVVWSEPTVAVLTTPDAP